jgi:hypothetical protein
MRGPAPIRLKGVGHARAAVVWFLVGLVFASSAGAWPQGVDPAIFSDGTDPGSGKPEPPPQMLDPGEKQDEHGSAGTSRVIGISLLGTGLFLCSWGIASWEVREYQCCPAHNTGNVVKIVAGLLVLNAGLIYLLEGHE